MSARRARSLICSKKCGRFRNGRDHYCRACRSDYNERYRKGLVGKGLTRATP